MRVMSATHFWFGLVAVKSRLSRSGAAVCLRFGRVDPCFQPLRKVGALAAVDAHDPLHALAVHLHAAAAQFQPHPRRAVGGGELVLPADGGGQPQQPTSSPARRDGACRTLRHS